MVFALSEKSCSGKRDGRYDFPETSIVSHRHFLWGAGLVCFSGWIVIFTGAFSRLVRPMLFYIASVPGGCLVEGSVLGRFFS